jgi:hypothetical protein
MSADFLCLCCPVNVAVLKQAYHSSKESYQLSGAFISFSHEVTVTNSSKLKQVIGPSLTKKKIKFTLLISC